MAAVSVSVWTLLSVCYLVSASEEQTVSVSPGQTAILPCQAPNNKNILAVEWIRSDLGSEHYVLLYRDDLYYPDKQHESFKNRVELQDEQMNNGDVSLVLKNVTDEDGGKYECHIVQRKTNNRKRSVLGTKPIKIIYLKVEVSGPTAGHREDGGNKDGGSKDGGSKDGGNKDRHVALGAALPVVGLIVVVVVVVGFMFYRKHKGSTEQSSYQPPTEAV
ncbi:putative butyrophilin subfamily 2 member A3 [Toxotes jaculatrix]|uniref:putative butyrophilin subfamily 2 member A3 n=1 Tax=Toxotes jaculatrix TaxID=941984 RepID=UPI001B3AC588|nr:putative butyrophilin subfamily 2 member A3 [Toxotes jaculatrix]XP_040887674.1 putative butyrophilin subfamily 2 member A3 [Toxotes jaculatrix]